MVPGADSLLADLKSDPAELSLHGEAGSHHKPMLARASLSVFLVLCCLPAAPTAAGTLTGYVRDRNWYARYSGNPYGVGCYEYAINSNATNSLATGAFAATDVYGRFTSAIASPGLHTAASWDVWWRSAYAFNVSVPTSGSSPVVDLRLGATMWGYPVFWDPTGYTEFGQTFVATGPIAMIYVRVPGSSGAYGLTVHEEGPGGPQLGEERSFGVGDQRLIYGYGQMPTVAGRTYYVRIHSATPGVITQMEPRPDFSDPMPGGCLWLGSQGNVQPFPDRDLGLVIMSDDDGLLTDMFTRSGGTTLGGASLGQTFTARGVNLISVALWVADPAAPTYSVAIRRDGPNGEPVGTVKRGRPARVTADPEMIVTWLPGECPLTPGDTYYVELKRADSASLNLVYANPNDPFAYGEAWQDGFPIAGTDLAGTIMEEESPGSAARPEVKISSEPQVNEAERSTNSLVVRWTTDVPSDSKVEFAVDTPPYTRAVFDPRLVTSHAVALPGLKPHAMVHYRVSSGTAGHREARSRDFAICTRPVLPNLLRNPGFEEGITTAGASRPLTNWTATGSVDIKEATAGWFGSLPPRTGSWLLQGAVNGSSSDGAIYQRVAATPGKSYTFSAWVLTKPLEKVGAEIVEKYDVWNNLGGNRLIYMRLGIDPFGGTNPQASTVQWTPRVYSHLRYSNLAKTAVAMSPNITVFVSMKGEQVEWHLYGVDDCVLTETALAQPVWTAASGLADGSFTAQIVGDPGTTNWIQTSPDLSSWSDLGAVPQTNAVVPFSDGPIPPGSNRFYRAVLR